MTLNLEALFKKGKGEKADLKLYNGPGLNT